jgi:hypothetical protein
VLALADLVCQDYMSRKSEWENRRSLQTAAWKATVFNLTARNYYRIAFPVLDEEEVAPRQDLNNNDLTTTNDVQPAGEAKKELANVVSTDSDFFGCRHIGSAPGSSQGSGSKEGDLIVL